MKRKQQFILIASTFIFLVLLLIIQINNLIETAEKEKHHFTQSVKLSLDLAATEISKDRQMCSTVQQCISDTTSMFMKFIKEQEWKKVDSLIKYNLEQYDLDIDYQFEIGYSKTDSCQTPQGKREICYSESANIELEKGGIELQVKFPDKNKFIIRRISTMFISSILLILMVMASFVLTLSMYLRELKLAKQTKNFINNMAHEFKTPLANIGFANSRIGSNKEAEKLHKVQKYTEIIEYERAKLQNNIDGMLELACLENKNSSFETKEIDVTKVLKTAIEHSKIAVEKEEGTIQIDCKLENALIIGCETHLLNCFSNLIENACKYSNGNLNISISCLKKGKHLIIEFVDNGIGISQKNQKLIFNKYYRVDTGDIHDIKGYGLGLSYVKEIIIKHNGKVNLKSKLGQGSIFTISLPLVQQNN